MPNELITGAIKDYAWGTPGGLDRVLGAPDSGSVQAEWWLGDHPHGEAVISPTGETLSAWLDRQGGRELGFLLKVLTPATPLSLQVHPTPSQAVAGFEREEAAGVDRDGPTRVFRDRLAKPEVIVALEDSFDALAGMATDDLVKERIDALVAAGYPTSLAQVWRAKLERGRAECVGWLLRGSADAREVVSGLGAVASSDLLLTLLWAHYPEDPGCAVGMMLNRVSLKAGEALFVDAGQLHAYLSGVGVELMAPSDNVVRGGLTPKHIDVDILLDIANFTPSPPPYLAPTVHSEAQVDYAPPGQAFCLTRVDTSQTRGEVSVTVHCPAICVNLDGPTSVDIDGESVELARGDARIIYSGSPTTLAVKSGGAVWLAQRR